MTKPIRKVLLTVPPTGLYIREDRCQTPIAHMKTISLRPPIDLMYAGACFERGGAECRLVDYPGEGLDEDALACDVRKWQPDLVLLSVTTPGFEDDMRVVPVIRQAAPDTIIAAKGAHFNTLDRQALERHADLDLALRGEFEPACQELAEGRAWGEIAGMCFRGGESGNFRDGEGIIVRTPDRPFINDLDTLPLPARHLANNALYARPDTGEQQTTIITHRGCPYACIFCLANQVAGRRNRVRSPASVLPEIDECVERHGIRNFLFRSDLFTADRQWVLDLCAEIERRELDVAWCCNSRVDTVDPETLAAMKRAGCWIVAYGVESGVQEVLDRIGKRTDLESARRAMAMTRQAGLLSSIYFVIGLPCDNAETLAASERFARELDPDVLEVFYAYPFPGTPLYAEGVRLGLLEAGEIPRSAYDEPAMASLHLSRSELARARTRALRRFYLRPRIIARTLARSRSWTELANYARYGWRQLMEFV